MRGKGLASIRGCRAGQRTGRCCGVLRDELRFIQSLPNSSVISNNQIQLYPCPNLQKVGVSNRRASNWRPSARGERPSTLLRV